MHFIFNRENHRADLRMSFDDITTALGKQLERFGHTWEINDRVVGLAADTVNVLFEGFSDEAIDVYGANYDKGAQYICLATEQPTGYDADGLGGEFNFGQPAHMIGRQARFVKACRRLNFRAVWALVAGDATLAWYRQHCERVAYLPIGYAPGAEVEGAPAPEFDFGMYGSIPRGGRRWKMLKRLHKVTGATVHVLGANGIVPVEDRDREMLRCKVLLLLRPNADSELVSSSRIAGSVRLRAVVGEHHKLPGPYAQVVRFAREDTFASFVEACILTLATWRGEHAAQLERFKTVLSPEATMLPCLEVAGLGRGGEERPFIRPAPIAGETTVGTLLALPVWGDDVAAWVRDVLPRLAADDHVPALARRMAEQAMTLHIRIYTTDAGVNELMMTPGIHELGDICDIELRGLAPAHDQGIFAGAPADALARVRYLAEAEAARAGQALTFMPVEMVAA